MKLLAPRILSPTYGRILQEMPEKIQAPDAPSPLRPHPLTLREVLYAQTIVSEVLMTVTSLLCGLWILLPFQIFDAAFPIWPKMLNEPSLGCWLVMIGTARAVALWRGHVQMRQACAFCSFMTWLSLWSWVLVTDWHRLSLIFFALFFLTSLWIFARGPSPIHVYNYTKDNPCGQGK